MPNETEPTLTDRVSAFREKVEETTAYTSAEKALLYDVAFILETLAGALNTPTETVENEDKV